MLLLTISAVSDNSANDLTFDGQNIIDGFSQWRDNFSNLPNIAPYFAKVGMILRHVWGAFPDGYWFAMVICLVCLTISRIVGRRH